MKSKRIIRVTVNPDDPSTFPKGRTDWDRVARMTDEEVTAAALSDPDCPPLTDEQLAQMRRVPNVRAIREKMGMSQAEFARRFDLDIRTVQDWEQGRRRPDRATKTLLRVIEADPKAVERALKKAS